MITNKDKYRNPPAPVGYVCTNPPQIVIRKETGEDEMDFSICDYVFESGILDEPDCSIYDHFVINSDSEDDELLEIPVEKCDKEIEVIRISDEDEEPAVEAKEGVLVAVEKKIIPEESTTCSKKLEDIGKITVKTEKLESCKETRKHDSEIQSSHKKDKQKKELSHSIDTESHTQKRKHKKKQVLKSNTDTNASRRDSKSSPKSKLKLCDYEDSDSHGSYEEKTDNGKQDSYKKRGSKSCEYDSDSSQHKIKGKIKHDYDKDDNKLLKNYNRYEDNDSKDDYKSSIKKEIQSQHLFGVYHCEVCNLTMNGIDSYELHIMGKRHRKALNAQNVAQTVAKSFASIINVTSKCSKPPLGFVRIELNKPAKIQHILERHLDLPCPGLHHVSEIQGAVETTYYCSLCDAPCNVNSIVPHLRGFKHQLGCLKHYNLEMYNDVSSKEKNRIYKKVLHELEKIEREKGRSTIKVLQDIPEFDVSVKSERKYRSSENAFQLDYNQPSTSRQGLSQNVSDFDNYNVPDPSKSGFYCRLCDSHSNSENMWQQHISGRKHLTNLKKAPGTAPSKSKYIPAPRGTVPILYSLLDGIDEPIVGLDQIKEIRKPDIDSVTFNCFMCNACISEYEIADHILSRKHREKYLERIDFEGYSTVRKIPMNLSQLESCIREMCITVEEHKGRGEPYVVFAKNAIIHTNI